MAVTREPRAFALRLSRRAIIGAATIGCACCRLLPRALAEEPGHAPVGSGPPHWAYEGEAGADTCGELSPAFKVYQLGLEQSPIDLATAVTAEVAGLGIAYQPMKLRIINNDHTIQVNAARGSSCVIGGTSYELQQFHFYYPSEHLLLSESERTSAVRQAIRSRMPSVASLGGGRLRRHRRIHQVRREQRGAGTDLACDAATGGT